MKNEIIIYQQDDLSIKLDVVLLEDTIWLTQNQIVILFDSSKSNISEHITHIFQTKELNEDASIRKFRTVQKEGNRSVSRDLVYYDLDVIISVGYRVNSIRGTQFRIWANKVLKEYLLKGYAVNQRFDRIEKDIKYLKNKTDAFDLQIKTSLSPSEGIFFDGNIFDAYLFLTDLVKSAKKSIILIDNYIDESVLTILSKRRTEVSCSIYSSQINKQLLLDVKKHNQQYPEIRLIHFFKSHDRFLIIDSKTVYHIGASLKDLGKKWFAFSKIGIDADIILTRLNEDSPKESKKRS
ncbi:MAG: DNA-binding protein [Bacteroidetes bacterium HGW-Bacteroidetes-21]|jgi:hypothetical protein|nr:MAG: DNA-binding protein [Bacteroidetes bacterium HGW-Bacteroidetes-21]